jgi:hypothetical protein
VYCFIGNKGGDNSECGEYFAEKLDARYLESPMQVLKTFSRVNLAIKVVKPQTLNFSTENCSAEYTAN